MGELGGLHDRIGGVQMYWMYVYIYINPVYVLGTCMLLGPGTNSHKTVTECPL